VSVPDGAVAAVRTLAAPAAVRTAAGAPEAVRVPTETGGGTAFAGPAAFRTIARCGPRLDGSGRHFGRAVVTGAMVPAIPRHSARDRGLLVIFGPGRRAGVPSGVTIRLASPRHWPRAGAGRRACGGSLGGTAAGVAGAAFAGPVTPSPALPAGPSLARPLRGGAMTTRRGACSDPRGVTTWLASPRQRTRERGLPVIRGGAAAAGRR
jgi:hypothetical protein